MFEYIYIYMSCLYIYIYIRCQPVRPPVQHEAVLAPGRPAGPAVHLQLFIDILYDVVLLLYVPWLLYSLCHSCCLLVWLVSPVVAAVVVVVVVAHY